MTSYYVRAHNDHYHVVADTNDTVLDDKCHFNPWMYWSRSTANRVADLLNHNFDPLHVKEMDGDQLKQSYRSITEGRNKS